MQRLSITIDSVQRLVDCVDVGSQAYGDSKKTSPVFQDAQIVYTLLNRSGILYECFIVLRTMENIIAFARRLELNNQDTFLHPDQLNHMKE